MLQDRLTKLQFHFQPKYWWKLGRKRCKHGWWKKKSILRSSSFIVISQKLLIQNKKIKTPSALKYTTDVPKHKNIMLSDNITRKYPFPATEKDDLNTRKWDLNPPGSIANTLFLARVSLTNQKNSIITIVTSYSLKESPWLAEPVSIHKIPVVSLYFLQMSSW